MTLSGAGSVTAGNARNLKSTAIAMIQGRNEVETSSTNKSADAWQGFYTALMSLKSHSHPSCGTPSTAMTEASLSEIGSSHGSSSPRKFGRDNEMEEDASDTDMSDMDPAEDKGELIPSPSSKRTRHRNRRRRTRGGRRSAARRAKLRAAHLTGCDKIDEEPVLDTTVATAPSNRDVVLLSDLGFESPQVACGCEAQSKMPVTTTDFLGPPRSPQAAAHTIDRSAVPSQTGGDACARAPAPAPLVTAFSPPGVRAPTNEFFVGTGSAHLPSGAAWPSQPQLPQQVNNGSCAVFLISPCPAWAGAHVGGIVSTSPMMVPSGPHSLALARGAASTSPLMAEGGPCTVASAGSIVSTSPMTVLGCPGSSTSVAMAGAGSRSADFLRSWLQASGLPPAADIVAQLHAATPEFYED